jgi:hypothetical protein
MGSGSENPGVRVFEINLTSEEETTLKKLSYFLSLIMLLAFATVASAQATRTWVSGVGDDANPCSRTAPCKTFAGAISKTATRGEIDVLDPGGFGGVTITKAITIDGMPFQAGVLVAGTNGITVNAPTTDVVTLRGLNINGNDAAGGFNGIQMLGGKALHVEYCRISQFSGRGINVVSTTPGFQLYVHGTDIRNNGANGILANPSAGTIKVVLDSSNFFQNGVHGVELQVNTAATATRCNFSGNGFAGFTSDGPSNQAYLESCSLTSNATGLGAGPAGTVSRISRCFITNNTSNGIDKTGGGTVVGFQNNVIVGNTGDNSVSSSTAQQ